jgi:hypothetical protein
VTLSQDDSVRFCATGNIQHLNGSHLFGDTRPDFCCERGEC